MLVRVTQCRKVYVVGYRLHHGRFGQWLLIVGVALVAHDWKDRPWPFRD